MEIIGMETDITEMATTEIIGAILIITIIGHVPTIQVEEVLHTIILDQA